MMKRLFIVTTMILALGGSVDVSANIRYIGVELVTQEICGPEYDLIMSMSINNNGHSIGYCRGYVGDSSIYKNFFRYGDTGEILTDDRVDGIVGLDDKNVVTVRVGNYPNDTWYQWDADTSETWRRDAHILPRTENGIYVTHGSSSASEPEPPSLWSKPFGFQEVPRPKDRECKPLTSGGDQEWWISDVSETYLTTLTCEGGGSDYRYAYVYDMMTEELRPLCNSCTSGSSVEQMNSKGEAIVDSRGDKSLIDLRSMKTILHYGSCVPQWSTLNNNGDAICDYGVSGLTLPWAIIHRDGTIDYIEWEFPPSYVCCVSRVLFNDKGQILLQTTSHSIEPSTFHYYLFDPVGSLR